MRSALIYTLFFLSGAAGLIYELVWVRELIFIFGGTTYAITTVLVAFMGGLGLGCYVAGRWCRRLHRPAQVYGLLEILIGAYALLVPQLFGLAEPAYRALYAQGAALPWVLPLARFGLSALILLVPTTCMGATLPVLVRHVTLAGGALGRSVGHLYGINTFGAVFGVLAAGFWLLPTLGLTHTTWSAATVSVLVGAAALLVFRGRVQPAAAPAPKRPARSVRASAAPVTTAPPPAVRRAVLVGFAVSGFAAMVYQITWTRALVMSLGSSTYSFTCILAAFILGLALGSLAVARRVDRWRSPARVFGVLELLVGLIAVVIVPIHGRVPLIAQGLITSHHQNYTALLVWEFLLIIAITFVPTVLMGAIFPLATRALAARDDEAGAATGRAYLVNTLGTIAGSFLAGFVLIRSDVLGVQNSIVLASVLNGVVGVVLLWLTQPQSAGRPIARRLVPIAVLVLIPAVGLGAGRWDPRVLTSAPYLNPKRVPVPLDQRQVVYLGEGVDVTAAVIRAADDPGLMALSVNGKPDASTKPEDMTHQLLLGHLPALVGPAGPAACVIGLGSGTTLSGLARYGHFTRLDCIEISDEVIRAAAYFAPYNYRVLTDDPRVWLIRADGRNHLLLSEQRYDLIVSAPSNPWMAGVANLFTREFFSLCRQRLTDDGVLGVWLQVYMVSVRDFQMVARTLLEVFDYVELWQLFEADCLMLASRRPRTIELEDFVSRCEQPAVALDLYRVGLYRPAHLLGRYIVGGAALRAWVAHVPVHTDDNALLEFSAPRYLYRGQERELTQAFVELQQPIDTFLRTHSGEPLPPALVSEVGGVVAARQAILRAAAAGERGDHLAALRTLLDGYRHDPSNLAVFRALLTVNAYLRNQLRGVPPSGQLAGLLAEIDRLPPPFITPREGASVGEVAAARRARADEALRVQLRDVAEENLLEARRLEPGHGGTELAYAWVLKETNRAPQAAEVLDAYLEQHPGDGRVSHARAELAARAGEIDRALTLLKTALESGATSAAQLLKAEWTQDLQRDPRFQALLSSGSASHPSRPDP